MGLKIERFCGCQIRTLIYNTDTRERLGKLSELARVTLDTRLGQRHASPRRVVRRRKVFMALFA